MPHGTPDWGHVGPKSTTYGLDDLGEHAVRLGSPHLWDRRGDVLIATDFREGLGSFRGFGFGTGAAVTLHAGNTRLGAYCVKLTGGSTLAGAAGLTKEIPRPVLSMLGLEFSFSVEDDTEYWRWTLVCLFAGRFYEAMVQWDHVNTRLERYEGVPVYTVFATGIDFRHDDQACNTGKLVVDLTAVDAAGNPAPTYRRFMVNEHSFEMRDPVTGIYWLLPFTVPGGPEIFRATVEHDSVGGANAEGYLDNLIVTHNEP